MNSFKIAIVGAGPGGLSAATHAAELGVSHILLESTGHPANTIQRYQKGKHVMDEPAILPLRSPLDFVASTREQVLQAWLDGLNQHQVNIQYQSEVGTIEGRDGEFTLTLKGQEPVVAEKIILAIGLQGNPRRLGAPGDDLPAVQYQLDDPDEYQGETIVVVGAGDAAIENAVALAKQNTVIIVNRRGEFARAKQGNLNLITQHIEDEKIQCYYKASVNRLQRSAENKPYSVVLNSESGEIDIPCDRIIARLGAVPPRQFVESCGIEFPNQEATALPVLSTTYESSVPGLYVIGALGGYPLIKQAMNQGYEVVEYIMGNSVEPADHQILQERLKVLPFYKSVDQTLQLLRTRIEMFGAINPLLFREFLLESKFHVFEDETTVYRHHEYSNSFYTVVSGSARVYPDETEPERSYNAGLAQVFGEQSLLSGRSRSETVVIDEQCVAVETPRRTMIKLINSNDAIRKAIDYVFVGRAMQRTFATQASFAELRPIIGSAQLQIFKHGEFIYQEGDPGDSLYLLRSGSVMVSRRIGDHDITLAYLPAGKYFGELGLLGNKNRMDTVQATVRSEVISISKDSFQQLMNQDPKLKQLIQQQLQRRLDEEILLAAAPESGETLAFFMKKGLGEGTDVLLIDETLCIGCDNCEKACAETHNGIPRLNREAGPSFNTMHIPFSCRHCEQPHCMQDCPPNAIHRTTEGSVYIDDTCIGCGNCVSNCPYDAIRMAYDVPRRSNVLSWLLTGFGSAPGADSNKDKRFKASATDIKKAYKCDACKDVTGGPACVRACPTGAALRVKPEHYLQIVTNIGQS